MSPALGGCRVVVCRAVEQSGPLIDALAAAGAVPVPFPLLEVVPPADGGAALGAAVDRLERYQWVLFTSANAVRAVVAALAGRPWPRATAVGAVGPATAAAARSAGIDVTLARPRGTGKDLAAAVPAPGGSGGVLLPLAELADPAVADHLRSRGWRVTSVVAYRTVRPPVTAADLARVDGADAALFTSGSTVDRFVEVAGPERVPPLVVCIGPATAQRARHHGMAVAATAEDQSDDGLVRALASVWPRR